MAVERGWHAPDGVSARGSFYSRWADRKHKKGLEFVSKHTGYVYQNVVKVNGKWEGRGFIGVEPKYANLSGGDKKLRSSPNITRNQLITAQKAGRNISFNVIKLRKPTIISFKKPTMIGAR